MFNIYIGINPDGFFEVQGSEIPFLTGIKLLSTVYGDVDLRRIIRVAVSIHLVVDAILRINTWLESDGATLDVRIHPQQLPAQTVHDLWSVQALLDSPVHAACGRLYFIQGVVDAQFCGAKCLTGFFHRLLIDGLTGIMEHDEESSDKEYRHKTNHPHYNLCG